MDVTLNRQAQIAASIERLIRNFKKDSAIRKTASYLKTKVDSLTSYWSEYESNDDLLNQEDDHTDAYFRNKEFDTTKNMYENGLKLILATQPYICPNNDDEGTIASGSQNRGSRSKRDELLSHQNTNFRAFQRFTKNIDMTILNEGWEIEDKLQLLQSRWKAIDETHWQIDNLLGGSDEKYEQEFSTHEHTFEELKNNLHRRLNCVKHQQSATPHIELPTFNGNYSTWPAFSDLYCEAIHNNPTLNKCQKMQHLKGKLKGEAERLVQHLNISVDNYDTCWELLNRRYNNIQLLFTKLIQTFMNQPTMQKHNAFEVKRLHDISMETVHAIHNLGVDTSTWDPILVHIMTEKMDPETYTAYMDARENKRDLPSLEELFTILESKFTALEPLSKKGKQNKHNTIAKENEPKHKEIATDQRVRFARSYKTHAERTCPLCKAKGHVLLTCKKFLNMTPDIKFNTTKSIGVCTNCLYHHKNGCTSTKKCKTCNKAHHTILHEKLCDTDESDNEVNPMTFKPTTTNINAMSPKTYNAIGADNEILLSTIELKVRARDGTFVTMRCLLDQGSQINLITESAAQRLGLERCNQKASVFGVGSTATHSNGVVQLICESRFTDYTFTTDALVMPKVIGNLPNFTFERQPWPHLQNIHLADAEYNISRPVDILLDAKVYAEIIMDGILRGPANAPIAQQTQLGWILVGNVKTFNCYAILNNLEEISQYWEMEEITQTNNAMTPEQEYCENLFKTTTTRRCDGRYEVKLPMKPDFEQHLAPSKPQAIAQFKQLEKKFGKDESLAKSYKDFIGEYINLGHMKLCSTPRDPSCFLPHHGVIRLDSQTTKLRTVFNASSKLKTGYSLNELMECGPNLQQDLQGMLLSWRRFEFVYTADIEKFYRQILIKEEDQHLQKIVWRDNTSDYIHEYQLCTVTYGTKAAPYLAMRTIKQLVQDDGNKYPLAIYNLNKQLYVDDLLGGSNNIEEAKEAQQQTIDILCGGGFNLRKWASNDTRLLQHLPADLISQNMYDFKHAETNKTLGLSWNPCTDQFTFQSTKPEKDKVDITTKRTLLSNLSKLYDPLGWLSPITIKGKIIFQKVWTTNIGWDHELPTDLQHEWNTLKQDLPNIDEIKIRRWIGNTDQPIELHGFCDASEKAYGCVIYCKSKNTNNLPSLNLVAGKTKLTPLNKTLSLPRLELCAALLLSKLMYKVIESLNIQKRHITIHGWTDSMVVLRWLRGDIGRWKTFVANRVANILEVMPTTTWSHVKSEENPADCASRGLLPSQLLHHSLWWEGPEWLKQDSVPQQTKTINVQLPEEEKKSKVLLTTTNSETSVVLTLLDRLSSVDRLTRVLSWVSRFIHNLRNKNNRRTMNLTVDEIRSAHSLLIRVVQNKYYELDISQLKNNKKLHRKSQLLTLNPWVDNNGILRVGGRLQHTNLSDQRKHPIIVPNNDKLSVLLINWAHNITLHGGARLTLTVLRTRYWMLGGMSAVKRQLQKCIRCVRFRATAKQQIMADLPKARVTPSRPFTHTGVDFAGPVEVKANKGRGIATTRGYIAIFICLSTKAIHLELVSDLSSITYLAAFKRLCARRGTPSHMYSDCGTNFVGAARSLKQEHRQTLQQYLAAPEVKEELTNSNVEWHFNAPSWPTAGGLWEAAVKRMKYHLKRVMGDQKLTFEEFATLLTQIEACLNSRPLVALTNSIEDLECLTPGHFLIGDNTLAPPLNQEVEDISLGTRWRLTERMYKDFWRQWSGEYLQTLQTRTKWHYAGNDLQIGDLVLIKEDNMPPARWLMGRVLQTHPGNDGRVRVVTLKTKNSDGVKRPANKLIHLPIEAEVLANQQHQKQQPETSNTNPKHDKQSHGNMRKKGSYNILNTIFLMLTMFTMVAGKHQSMEVTTLRQEQPLYFDKIAEMQVIQDEWKMVVYYNLSTYWQGLTNIKHYTTLIDDFVKDEPTFRIFTTQLQHEVTELENYNNILKVEHGRRLKRGLIDGVGYVANSLFSILDQRFATKYNDDINKIQENENHLINLFKQHTSIIEGENNILKRHEEMMVSQFSSINDHMIALKHLTEDNYKKTMYITATVLTANSLITNLRQLQKDLLDLVTDVRSGHMDSHLLTPEEFEAQLNVIGAQTKDITLPCTSSQQDCIREMYKLSRVHVRISNNHIMLFEVKLPLLNIEQFELNRVIPIPRIHKQTLTATYIKPTAKYSAINLKKDMIIPMTEDEVQTGCISYNENRLLCQLNTAIYTTTNKLSTLCEAQVINNNNLSNCGTTVKACSDEWIILHSRAAWLFTCCQECAVRIFCTDSTVTSDTLQGTGITTVWPGCMLKGDNVIIHSSKTYNLENYRIRSTA